MKKLVDENVLYKLFTLYAIFDVAYKSEEHALKIQDTNGGHKDRVRPVYIIMTESEYNEEANFFPVENYQARADYNEELIKEIYLSEYVRQCSNCSDLMDEGYIIDDSKYYCNDKCLHKHYSHEEYMEMYENDVAYWTTFY